MNCFHVHDVNECICIYRRWWLMTHGHQDVRVHTVKMMTKGKVKQDNK